MTASITLQGMDRLAATRMMEKVGFVVEHRNDHRGMWSNSKIINVEGEKIGNITPAKTREPLQITLVLQLLSPEETMAIWELVNDHLMPVENKGS
jgi:hypothetical protein